MQGKIAGKAHFEVIINPVVATQIVFQPPDRLSPASGLCDLLLIESGYLLGSSDHG